MGKRSWKLVLAAASLFMLFAPLFAFADNNEKAWDVLRPVSELAKQFDPVVQWFLLTLSVAILAISVLAYRKSKSRRIALISFAFFIFSLKAVLKVLDLYVSTGNFFSASANDVADFLIMLSLFVAVFYRKSHEKFFERDSK
ncbi:Uncharacterised protein [uncultured archaeon]|nr:Uncharacterised protein [uncultured archaeon]